VSELFQMGIVVSETDLRPVLHSKLDQWAGQHYRRLNDDQIEQATPEEIRGRLAPDATRTQMLRQAARLCAEDDTKDSGRRLIALYANVANLIYEFERVSVVDRGEGRGSKS